MTARRHPPTKEHNYVRKISSMVAAGVLTRRAGEIGDLSVLHDEWCDSFKGDYCNCNPEIRLWAKRKVS